MREKDLVLYSVHSLEIRAHVRQGHKGSNRLHATYIRTCFHCDRCCSLCHVRRRSSASFPIQRLHTAARGMDSETDGICSYYRHIIRITLAGMKYNRNGYMVVVLLYKRAG